MSNYYDYRDVKVMIAHKLMSMEGWKVYGYKEDRSDSMTDYYDPANWGGVAEKNGYILCVNVYGASEKQEIRKYNYGNFSYDHSITEKIKKLENMTVERGASEQEEESAKKMILSLQKKAEGNAENNNKYVVIGYVPAHQANPPRMNWHIEKDGIIVAKGNGILKYARVDSYFNYDTYRKSYEDFKKLSKDEYIQKDVEDSLHRGYYTDVEKATRVAESHYEDMQEKAKLIEQFESFINKLDTTCGNLVGNGEIEQYEKITVTEYKKENKVVEVEEGKVKEGQLFILKGNFNYGCRKGLVYRIHETEYNGKKSYHAYNLNRKLTKELTGRATQSNYWCTFGEKFDSWIERGLIAWCKIEEVKTSYEVEKVVKKKVSNAKKNTKQTTDKTDAEEIDIENLTFEITEDVDTRDNSKIYVAKIKESLNREDYQKVNSCMKSIGGYYSRFKKGFLFKEDPGDLLKGNITKVDNQEVGTEEKIVIEPEPKKIKRALFTINESLAKQSRQLWSFTEYKSNSSTEVYKNEVEEVYKIVDKIAKLKPNRLESAIILAEKYSKKYAEWINKGFNIEMMCPSVMISGAGNFPTKRKEKQNHARDKHMKDYEYIKDYINKLKIILYGKEIIKSNDKDAIEKLQDKLDELEELQKNMKETNAYYRKNKTLKGYKELTEKQALKLDEEIQDSWYKTPYGSFHLTNNNAKIKNTKARIEQLQKVKDTPTQETIVTDICKVVENTEIMRIQLFFDGKPDADTRNILKSNGFRWAPSYNAWQRQLTNNARYGIKRVIEQLEELQAV